MTIQHRDAFELGYSLIRLFGIETFGEKKKREYELEVTSIHSLLRSLEIEGVDDLLRPVPDESRLSVEGKHWEEYNTLAITIGSVLRSGKQSDIYYSYSLGWQLPALIVILKTGTSIETGCVANFCNDVQRLLEESQSLFSLPKDLVDRLQKMCARAKDASPKSTLALELVDEISEMYKDLPQAFEAIPSLPRKQITFRP